MTILFSLPYTPEDVKKWYFDTPCPLLKDGPAPKDVKTVLVAASTGETSILVQRPILDHMYALQHVHRTHRFVWKLHPSNYNIGDYDVNYAPHAEELKNLTFIRSSFEVTDEWKPSLLPFLKTFPILLCDLHSTVAFMASYFAPKVLHSLAWKRIAISSKNGRPSWRGIMMRIMKQCGTLLLSRISMSSILWKN